MTLNFGAYMIPASGTPTNARSDADAVRPAEDVRGDVRRPQHRVPAQRHRAVGNRSGVHQGAEGEARREQDDDDPDQPGVRDRRIDLRRPNAAGRQKAIDHTKQWIDIAVAVRLPARDDQPAAGQLTKETRAHAVAAWKAMADYGKTKNVKVSAETRGAGTPEQVQQLGMKPWEYMARHHQGRRRGTRTWTSATSARRTSRSCTTASRPGSPIRPATCTSSRARTGTSARQ